MLGKITCCRDNSLTDLFSWKKVAVFFAVLFCHLALEVVWGWEPMKEVKDEPEKLDLLGAIAR